MSDKYGFGGLSSKPKQSYRPLGGTDTENDSLPPVEKRELNAAESAWKGEAAGFGLGDRFDYSGGPSYANNQSEAMKKALTGGASVTFGAQKPSALGTGAVTLYNAPGKPLAPGEATKRNSLSLPMSYGPRAPLTPEERKSMEVGVGGGVAQPAGPARNPLSSSGAIGWRDSANQVGPNETQAMQKAIAPQKSKLQSAIEGAVSNPSFKYQATNQGFVDVNGNNLRDQFSSGIRKRLQGIKAGQPDSPNETGLTQAIRSEIATGNYIQDDKGNYLHKVSRAPIEKALVDQFDQYTKALVPPRQAAAPAASQPTVAPSVAQPAAQTGSPVSVNQGDYNYNKDANGEDFWTNKQTGALMQEDVQRGIGVQRANQIADSAAANRNPDMGVGDRMNQRRQSEMDDVQSGWNSYYARKDAELQDAAKAAGVSPQEYRETKRIADAAKFKEMQRLASIDAAQKLDWQAQRDAINPRNREYREGLAASRQRQADAVARSHRFERGLPKDAEEAMLFAMQRGMMSDPNKAMESFGTGSMNLGKNDSELAAKGLTSGVDMYRAQNDALTARNADELAKLQANQTMSDNAIKNRLGMRQMHPDQVRYLVGAENDKRVAAGEISREQADAMTHNAWVASIPQYNAIASDPLIAKEYGLVPYQAPSQQGSVTPPVQSGVVSPSTSPRVPGLTEQETAAIVGNAQPSPPSVQPPPSLPPTVPIPGEQKDRTLASPEQVKDVYDRLSSSGRPVTRESLQAELGASGLFVNDEVIGQVKKRRYTNANEDGFLPWLTNSLALTGSGNYVTDETMTKAKAWNDLARLFDPSLSQTPPSRGWFSSGPGYNPK